MIAAPASGRSTEFGLQSACLKIGVLALCLNRGKSMCSAFVGGLSMAVYVVTGGGGFIGSHIVEELLRRNETVKVIDNFSTGKRENVEPFEDEIEIIEADIADARNLAQFLKHADYVIHQAAIPSVPKSIIDPVKSHHANVN